MPGSHLRANPNYLLHLDRDIRFLFVMREEFEDRSRILPEYGS
jgi:hypothetical protein